MDRSSQRARLYLANLYVMQSDFDACEEILQPCVDKGLAPAMYILAMAKLQQRPKTAQRWEDARILLEEASTLGDPGAQWALGRRMARAESICKVVLILSGCRIEQRRTDGLRECISSVLW